MANPKSPALAAMTAKPQYLDSLFNADNTDHRDPVYQQWKQNYDLQEDPTYDLFAAYQAGMTPDDRGHLGDMFKLPTHPTFSDESKYSGQNGQIGGQWLEAGPNKWTFKASPHNLQNMPAAQLMDYFDRIEPGNTLQLPTGQRYVGGSRKR